MRNWDDLRFFLVLARRGNLTAAAQELDVAQSTVGRRLASLEASLGTRLLDRTPDGYVLTVAGETVRDQALRIEAETLAVERQIGGRDSDLAGVVRIVCPETIAAHLIAPCVATIRADAPALQIELLPDPRNLSLAMREADIAVRLSQPVQNDLVVRRLGGIAFALYASRDYLDTNGLPDCARGSPGHQALVLVDDISSAEQRNWMEAMTGSAQTALLTASHETLLVAARAGAGLACLARFRADADPELVLVNTPVPPITSDLYLLVHSDNRETRRIRIVLDAIADAIRLQKKMISPTPALE